MTSSVVDTTFTSLEFRRSSPFAVTSSSACFCALYPRDDVTGRDFNIAVYHLISSSNINQTWLRLDRSVWPSNSFEGLWLTYMRDDVTTRDAATLSVAVQFDGARASRDPPTGPLPS